MKTLNFKTIIIIAICTLAFSCKKKETAYPVENPLAAYMASLSDITPATVNSLNSEFGLTFTPKEKGNLNGIQVKLPAVNNALRVTIWDAATKANLRTELVDVTTINTVITKNITALALEKDKQYTITMNTGQYYYYGSSGGAALTTYPLTIGNIIFNNFIYFPATTLAEYPTIISPGEYAGELNVVFQQTQ